MVEDKQVFGARQFYISPVRDGEQIEGLATHTKSCFSLLLLIHKIQETFTAFLLHQKFVHSSLAPMCGILMCPALNKQEIAQCLGRFQGAKEKRMRYPQCSLSVVRTLKRNSSLSIWLDTSNYGALLSSSSDVYQQAAVKKSLYFSRGKAHIAESQLVGNLNCTLQVHPSLLTFCMKIK